MKTRKGRAKFRNFQIFFDSGCSSTIVIRRLIELLDPKKYNVVRWHTQAVNITTSINFKIDLSYWNLARQKIYLELACGLLY